MKEFEKDKKDDSNKFIVCGLGWPAFYRVAHSDWSNLPNVLHRNSYAFSHRYL